LIQKTLFLAEIHVTSIGTEVLDQGTLTLNGNVLRHITNHFLLKKLHRTM